MKKAKGYILLEATIALIVLSLALVSLLPLFVLSIRANRATERIAAATHLSEELLAEISLRKWDAKTPSPPRWVSSKSPLGLDPGETPGDKKGFDDIDDFNGWSESPPQDPVGRPIGGMAGYAREATVSFVDGDLKPSATPTDYKQVTVCTKFATSVPICLDQVFTNR